MDPLKPNHPFGAQADAGDEATTQVASSPDGAGQPTPGVGQGTPGVGQANSAADQAKPTVAAGEPEAPVGPAVVGDDERGADQDPDAVEEEQAVQRDLSELTEKASKADEYLELAQRTKADFENFRKRAAREAAAAQERGIAKLARELLPAVDNLDRALQAAHETGNGEAGTLASGIKLVHDDVIAALGRVGIEPYSPKGEQFDPQCHEAVASQPVEGAEPGTVVEVYQLGYRLGESVLRPARVVVAG
jgi:molecular chaperone GrpE